MVDILLKVELNTTELNQTNQFVIVIAVFLVLLSRYIFSQSEEHIINLA
jgi:hypothetical protein